METTVVSPSASAEAPVAEGELIILNGQASGQRRALIGPLTFIGRAEWCDLRVEAESVNPWHCVVARGEAGLVLRDLHSDAGTLVNGQPTAVGPLVNGDVLTVGPLDLRVYWAAPTTLPLDELDQERTSLATRAAALTDEEDRLQQRRLLLDRQEKYLATEQERERVQLLQLREEVRKEQAALIHDRDRYEERVAQVHQDLARDRLAMAERQSAVRKDTARLHQLRLRLTRRWERQRVATQAQLQTRATLLVKAEQALDAERAAFLQERLRYNGDMELGRRELQAAWEAFRQAQRAREAEMVAREEALRAGEAALDARQEAVAAAEQEMAWRSEQVAQDYQTRCQELDGLENRILNHRVKLFDLEQDVARLEKSVHVHAPAAAVEMVLPPLGPTEPLTCQTPESNAYEEQLAALEAVAEELADQRLYLVEQCERLAQARAEWQAERAAVVADLEGLARRLDTREQALQDQEHAVSGLEQELHGRQAELERRRVRLEAERVRFAAHRAAWDGERNRVLEQVQAREDQAETALEELSALRERWQSDWQALLSRFHDERAAPLDAARFAEFTRRLREQAETLAQREAEFVRQQTAWEHLQVITERENAKLRLQHEVLHGQSARYAQQVYDLQSELDHLACLLLDEPLTDAPGLLQAA